MTKTPSVLDHYPEYECTIGMEVHVQLNTRSKIFCSCPNQVAQEPNTNICVVCAGYPGTLPVLNSKVVDYAVLAGLATNCSITPVSEFARKHYFYPDLPKGYQITQADKPTCQEGFVAIRLEDGSDKKIRLIRIHIEEDAGKSLHAAGTDESFVDLNRAGTPLLEMVSYPDISSAYETKAYLKAIRAIVQYLGICSGNMEDGAFRADTNISVRKKGATQLGTKCELKNINSFKFIGDAIEYEIQRQIDLLESGGKVRQETRLWDTKRRETIMMRSKEEAADYRYFPDPDLPLIELTQEQVNRIAKDLPELPEQKFKRFCSEGLSAYEAEILVEDLELANYYDAARVYTTSNQLINWILRDLMKLIKDEKVPLDQCKVTPELLAELVDLVQQGVINNKVAQEVFAIVAQTGQKPSVIVRDQGLEQIGSVDEIEALVREIVALYPKQVEQYRSGKDKLFGFFVGQMMQKTKGKADPQVLQDLLKKHLG